MSATLGNQMLSYVRQLRRSIAIYNGLARQYPGDAPRYKAEARKALREACFWLRWARDEFSRASPHNYREAAE